MTRFFVTTGTSVLESARCWKQRDKAYDGIGSIRDVLLEDPRDEAKLDSFVKDIQIRNDILAKMNGLRDADKDEDADQYEVPARKVLEKRFDLSCWAPDKIGLLSAELSTLHQMHVNGVISPDSTVQFLGGRTNAQAAWLVTEMMRAINSEWKLGYAIEGPQELYDWEPHPGDFYFALSGMAAGIERLNGNHDLHLVLTGGYKGVLLELVIQFVSRLRVARKNMVIYYLAENNGQLIDLRLNHAAAEPGDGNTK